MHDVLISPLITEKMTNLTSDKGKYGFLVNPKANKIEIAKTIEKKFNVHVVSVRTINHPGKMKTQFRKAGRYTGKTSKYKKALITLKQDEKIEIFEQV
jgi:large subunit ribosomal protein L23